MSVISGQANSIDPSHDFSKRWTIFAPGATLRVDIKIDETTEFEGLAVGGYLPGTDVAQFEAVTPALTTITSLPATGGPPPAPAGNARDLVLVGASLLLVAAACVVIARRLRPGGMP
jgi:hypothetical protein